MNRIVATSLIFLASVLSALAGSTINPNSPGQRSDLTSAPLRSNFLAAYTDINNILGCFAGSVPPASPTNLQSWCDTSASPNYVFKYRNNQTSAWVPYGTLNVNTGVWSPYASAASYLATAPISVSVSGGVVTYSLLRDSNFAVNGSSQLALTSVASGHLLANGTGGSAEPTDTTWTAFADQAIGSTNGMIPSRVGGSWSNVSTGVTGHVLPFLDGANTWSAAQTITLNATTLPAADSGTLLALGNVDGTVTRIEMTSAGSSPIVTGRTSLGTLASPLTLTSGTLMMSVNAHGYDGTSWSTLVNGSYRIYAEGTWSNTSHPTEACVSTTPSASTTIADILCVHNDGGATLGAVSSQGVGTLNLLGSLFNNGTAPSGTGGYVRATAPTIAGMTLSGTLSGGGNQINNVSIGAVSPGTIIGTQITGNTSLTSPILGAPSSLTFQTNGSTFAGLIDTNQKWFIGGTSSTADGTLTINNNTAATVSPIFSGATLLHIVGANSVNPEFVMDAFGGGVGPDIIGRLAQGTLVSKTGVVNTNIMLSQIAQGWDTTGYSTGANIQYRVIETWGASAHGSEIALRTAAAGATALADRVVIQSGMQVGAPTGGDKGVGTINATGYFNNGTAVTGTGTMGTVTITPGTGLSSSGTCTSSTTISCTLNNTGVTSVAGAGMASGTVTTTGSITVTAASKADQQTGTSAVNGVTPLHQQDHDSALKAHVSFTGTAGGCPAGACAILEALNVSSVAKTGTGTYTLTFGPIVFGSVNYSCTGNATNPEGVFIVNKVANQLAITTATGGAAADATTIDIHCAGRQ